VYEEFISLACIQEFPQKLSASRLEKIIAQYDAKVTQLIENMSWGQDFQGRYGMSCVHVRFLVALLQLFAEFAEMIQLTDLE
jgi:hypothetical protein